MGERIRMINVELDWRKEIADRLWLNTCRSERASC